MKFSELWLREWVNPAIDSEALSDQITMAGLEVDGVEPVAGSFNGVVVGEVVECGQHPNADKLRVTKVNVGGERLLDIVCGAPNCRQGLKVAVATIGAVLPGDFKIKAAKLRGEPSGRDAVLFLRAGYFPTTIAVSSNCRRMRRSALIFVNTSSLTITLSKSASRQTVPTAWVSSVWRAMSLC